MLVRGYEYMESDRSDYEDDIAPFRSFQNMEDHRTDDGDPHDGFHGGFITEEEAFYPVFHSKNVREYEYE
jgi:hypothetical protein